MSDDNTLDGRLRVLVLGATGTAGQATTRALLQAGHEVSCLVRTEKKDDSVSSIRCSKHLPLQAELLVANVTDSLSLRRDVFAGRHFDAMVSCMASRTGVPTDAWAIDHDAHALALTEAKRVGVKQMVLLSAICVQKPLLEFQHAKLAFERTLIDSGLTYTIVRPTAFFKSLSGQVDRVRRGKAFMLFGDGRLTACKPISDNDLGNYIANCVTNKAQHNRILPIGGPGKAITLREQGELLFELAGRKPKFKQVPIALFDGIRIVLEQLGRFSKTCADKAELARIGRYYATESMLVLNPETDLYDADATPSTGTDTLSDFYAALLEGSVSVERGEHAVFRSKSKTPEPTAKL